MKITRIKFLNVMGLEEFSLEPGRFTKVSGPNAAGKSSIASGIVSVSKGAAHQASLIRNGAKEAKIVVEIDDGMNITKSIRPDASDVKVRDDAGKVVARPVSVIQSMLNPSSVNPLSFFTADKDERKKILLKAMPIQADPARLEKIAGTKVTFSGNAWDVINALHKQIYNERTATNRAATEKRNTINQISNALPQQPANPVDVESLTEKLAEIDALKNNKFEAIEKKITRLRAEFKALEANAAERLNNDTADLKAQIQALQAKIAEREILYRQELSKIQSDLNEQEQLASKARSDQTIKWQQDRGALDLQMKEARALIEAEGRVKQSRETIALMTKEAEELEEDSKKQTKALEDLDNYKTELMASLPIKGLEVRGDDIYFTDPEKPHEGAKVWDKINEAKRMELAVQIGLLQSGEVKFLLVDGAERMDFNTQKLLEKCVEEAGAQCIAFEVDHSPDASGLKVEVVK